MITAETYADEALLCMKSRPPIEGRIGVVLEKLAGPGWQWVCYFRALGMTGAAGFALERLTACKPYTVPATWPDEFDPGWRRERCPAPPRGAEDLSQEQREAIAERIKAMFPQAEERRRAEAKPVEPRPMSEAEAESARRMLSRYWA